MLLSTELGVVETGQGPLCHISHPYWPAVAVPGALSCPHSSFGVLTLAPTHLTKCCCLQVCPPAVAPQTDGDGTFPALSESLPQLAPRAVSPLPLQSCRSWVVEGGSWRSVLCSRASVSPPCSLSPDCSMCPLAPNREASSRGLFNFSII